MRLKTKYLIGIVVFITFIAIVIFFIVRELQDVKRAIARNSGSIARIESKLNNERNRINELEEKAKKQEKIEQETLKLPTCDSKEITDIVFDIFKNTHEFVKSGKIVLPTTVAYDKDIPRYECVASVNYRALTTFAIAPSQEFMEKNGIEKNFSKGVKYSVSMSKNKPVVYAEFERYVH